jgi:hypothetical protein
LFARWRRVTLARALRQLVAPRREQHWHKAGEVPIQKARRLRGHHTGMLQRRSIDIDIDIDIDIYIEIYIEIALLHVSGHTWKAHRDEAIHQQHAGFPGLLARPLRRVAAAVRTRGLAAR